MFSLRFLTALALAAILFFDASAIADKSYKLKATVGEWDKKLNCRRCGREIETYDDIDDFAIPDSKTCFVEYDAEAKNWVCNITEDPKACRTTGVAVFAKKDGTIGLDHYRTRFGYNTKAKAHFCAAKGVVMTKKIGKPVFFYVEAPKAKEDVYNQANKYISVSTSQKGIAPAEDIELSLTKY